MPQTLSEQVRKMKKNKNKLKNQPTYPDRSILLNHKSP